MIWPVDSLILSCQSGVPNNPERCPKKDTFLVKAPLFERLSNCALFQTVKRKISPDLWREHDKLLANEASAALRAARVAAPPTLRELRSRVALVESDDRK